MGEAGERSPASFFWLAGSTLVGIDCRHTSSVMHHHKRSRGRLKQLGKYNRRMSRYLPVSEFVLRLRAIRAREEERGW